MSQYLKTVELKICCGRKTQLAVSNQVVTNPCCRLAVIFYGLIPLLIGHKTINIPEIFSGVHGFTGKTVTSGCLKKSVLQFIFLCLLSESLARCLDFLQIDSRWCTSHLKSQGLRLTFQLASPVASDMFDSLAKTNFSLARRTHL